MPRKRKRKKLNPGPILALLFAANVVAGVFLSPLTAVSKVRVIGAQEPDQAAIRSQFDRIQGEPALKVNPHRVESRLLALDAVKDAEFSRNVFGRATVRLKYRKPVAMVVGSEPLALSEEGVVYRTRVSDDSLPTVRYSVAPEGTYATLTSPWPGGHIAEMCRELRTLNATLPMEVIVSMAGAVQLNIGPSFSTELGSTEGLDEKLKALKQHLERDPEMLERRETLVLVAPEQPVVRPRGAKE